MKEGPQCKTPCSWNCLTRNIPTSQHLFPHLHGSWGE